MAVTTFSIALCVLLGIFERFLCATYYELGRMICDKLL